MIKHEPIFTSAATCNNKENSNDVSFHKEFALT